MTKPSLLLLFVYPLDSLLCLDVHSDGALNRLIRKAQATARAGHRVAAFIQGRQSRGREHWQSIGATVLAHFPAGTIAWGHAAGWPGDQAEHHCPTHAYSLSLYGCLRPPSEDDGGPMRRHPKLFNERDVSLLCFSTMANAPEVGDSKLRELAYLVTATGGRAHGSAVRWAPMWYGLGGVGKTLSWAAQLSSKDLDFRLQ